MKNPVSYVLVMVISGCLNPETQFLPTPIRLTCNINNIKVVAWRSLILHLLPDAIYPLRLLPVRDLLVHQR